MSRSQKARRKQWIVVLICFLIVMSPIAVMAGASCERLCPSVPFGGGGGDAFNNPHLVGAFGLCGPICQGIVGWIVSKVGDWLTSVPCGQVGYCNPTMPDGPIGGGGGDAFYIERK